MARPRSAKHYAAGAVMWLYVCVAAAGDIEVLPDAATKGGNGLRVSAGKACMLNDVTVTGQTVTTDQVACDTISTSGSVAVTEPVTFAAGEAITLGAGFSVASGTTFRAGIKPFLESPYASLRDESPASETSYNARFDLNVDGLNLADGEYIDHFTGLSATGAVEFRVTLNDLSGKELVLFARSGGTVIQHPTAIPLGLGVNRIFVQWRAADGTGRFQVTVNGGEPEGPTTLYNNDGRVDAVEWGLIDGPAAPTTSGYIDLDDFASFR